MSIRRIFQAQPTSEEVLKKVEMSIVKEAKSEEKNLHHLVKDLTAAEKTTHKAQKVKISRPWGIIVALISPIGCGQRRAPAPGRREGGPR
jgi:hypothetical protein